MRSGSQHSAFGPNRAVALTKAHAG